MDVREIIARCVVGTITLEQADRQINDSFGKVIKAIEDDKELWMANWRELNRKVIDLQSDAEGYKNLTKLAIENHNRYEILQGYFNDSIYLIKKVYQRCYDRMPEWFITNAVELKKKHDELGL